MPRPQEVFLSHSSTNRSVAGRIADTIRAHGISVWYSQQGIVGAQQWHDEIGKALKRCDWFSVLLSPDAVASLWVRRELHYALRESRFENHIIPIRYLPCDPDELSWTLTGFQMVDFSGSVEQSFRDLLDIWEIELDMAKIAGPSRD